MLRLVTRGLVWATLSLCALQGAACADDLSLSQPPSVGRSVYQPAVPASEPIATEPQVAEQSPGGLPLAPRRERSERELLEPRAAPGNSKTLTTVVGSLAVVLGLFFVVAWCMRRTLPASMTRLPSEVVEMLGRAPLAGKQNLHLLRVGGKLVLVVVTPFGAETLTEVTHPDEVERLIALCKQNSGHGPTAEFRAVLRQFEREPAAPGFLGETHRSDVELANAPRGRRGGYDA